MGGQAQEEKQALDGVKGGKGQKKVQNKESCDEEKRTKSWWKCGRQKSKGWKATGQKTAGVRVDGRLKDGFLRLVMTYTSRLKDVSMASYGMS